MTFDQAARILGINLEGLTELKVRQAFVDRVQAAHATGTFDTDMARIKEAKNTLLRIAAATYNTRHGACTSCNGTGKVPGLLGVRKCVDCKGTGQRV